MGKKSKKRSDKKLNIKFAENERNLVFILGMLVGMVVFMAIFGVRVLDFMHDGWIFKSNNDLQQHYLGWMAYRQSPWSFPLGMTDMLSKPYSMSIIYTDSIPLIALLFKILSFMLPETFQYFGLFALSSFMLTGGFAARLVWRFVKGEDNRLYRLAIPALFTVFFVLSFIFMRRTFYHTSLTAQWILLLCIELWFDGLAERRLYDKLKVYALIGFLCTGIHLYFFPMALCILAAAEAESLIKAYNKEKLKSAVLSMAIMCLSGVVFLALMGAFGAVDGANYWIGDFTMNLNSFFNSMGNCRFFKGMPLLGELQIEGVCYLGAGVLLLVVLRIGAELYNIVKTNKNIIKVKSGYNNLAKITDLEEVKAKINNTSTIRLLAEKLLNAIKRNPRNTAAIGLCIVLTVAAVFPTVAFGDRLLFRVPLPDVLKRLFGIFRSNGRFIWPVAYMILLAPAQYLTGIIKKRFNKVIIVGVVVICVIVQIIDFQPWIVNKNSRYYEAQQTYRTVWDEIELPEMYDSFISFETDNSFMMQTAYYALRHHMSVNRFYFARDIDETLDAAALAVKEEIIRSASLTGLDKEGVSEAANEAADDKTIYVFNRETYEDMKDCGLHFYATRKCIFGVKSSIPGLEEFDEADIDNIAFRE